MTDTRHKRLEQYETSAAECDMLARLTTSRSKQAVYEHMATHYRDLAAGFREALATYNAALTRLTLH